MVKTMEKNCQPHQCLPTIFLGLQMEIPPELKIPENNVQFQELLIRMSTFSSGLSVSHLELSDIQQTLIKSLQLVCFCLVVFPLPVRFCLDCWLDRQAPCLKMMPAIPLHDLCQSQKKTPTANQSSNRPVRKLKTQQLTKSIH